MIVYKCSNNNNGSTVLETFQKGVHHFGLPLRVRCDQGTENHEVALHMLKNWWFIQKQCHDWQFYPQSEIRKVMDGHAQNCHNTILSFILFLEIHSLLDSLNEVHLFALSYIYLPRINSVLNVFTEEWNHHGIREAHNHSLYHLFVSVMLQLHSSGITALDFLFTFENNYGIARFE